MKTNSQITLGIIGIIVGGILIALHHFYESDGIFNLEGIGVGVIAVGLITLAMGYFKKPKN